MLTRSLSKLMLDSPTNTKLVPLIKWSPPQQIIPTNYLLIIPDELLTRIFSFLPLSDIGMICLTGSSLLRDKVVAWITTTSCCKKIMEGVNRKMMEQQAGYDNFIRVCHQFGMLCKRASMLYSTSTRLRLLSSWYSRLECLVSDRAKLWGKLGLAAASTSFSLGWDEAEFGKLMEWVGKVQGRLEGDGRKILRVFFWEFVENEDTKASWLSYIIRTLPSSSSSSSSVETQAADLLYLLLGPAEEDLALLPLHVRDYSPFMMGLHTRLQGKPNLNIMQEQVPYSYSEAKEMFSDLGRALRLLIRNSSSITGSLLTSIMTSLFNDLHWQLDNQAACLLFSCEAVVKMFLADLTRKKDGVVELSHMLVAMMVVCGRLSNNIDQGIDKILNWSFVLLKGDDKKRMIVEFWKEVAERMEEGDIVEDIFVQVGVFIGGRAYGFGSESQNEKTGVEVIEFEE